jgi:hypothetical protein
MTETIPPPSPRVHLRGVNLLRASSWHGNATDALASPPTRALTVRHRCFFHSGNAIASGAARSSLTVRDVIAWAEFCVKACASGALRPWHAYAHGAFLTLLDGLGLGLGISDAEATGMRRSCLEFIRSQLPAEAQHVLDEATFVELPPGLGLISDASRSRGTKFGVAPFFIAKVRSPPARKVRLISPCATSATRVVRCDDTHEMSSF